MAEEDENPEVEEEASAPSRLPLIIGIVGALVLGVGGGGAGVWLMSGSDSNSSSSGDDDGEAVLDKNRVVYDLGRFRVNLRGSGGQRVLHIEVAVEMERKYQKADTAGEEVEDVLEPRIKAQLRDAVITLVSDYTYGDLEGSDGKIRFRDELMGRLLKLAPNKKILRIYFTQFMVN
jgi:flagellar FliL protein